MTLEPLMIVASVVWCGVGVLCLVTAAPCTWSSSLMFKCCALVFGRVGVEQRAAAARLVFDLALLQVRALGERELRGAGGAHLVRRAIERAAVTR